MPQPRSRAPPGGPHGLFLGGTGSLDLPYLDEGQPTPAGLPPRAINGRSLLRPLTADVPEGCAEELWLVTTWPWASLGLTRWLPSPAWGTRDLRHPEFTLTTRSQKAPLAFQAGGRQGTSSTWTYLRATLRAVVEKGQGTVLLHNSVPVADGQPHEVSVHVDAHQLEISVDQYPTRTSNRGVLSYLEPRGNLLLGGWMLRPLATSRSTAWAWLSTSPSWAAWRISVSTVRGRAPGSLADLQHGSHRLWRKMSTRRRFTAHTQLSPPWRPRCGRPWSCLSPVCQNRAASGLATSPSC